MNAHDKVTLKCQIIRLNKVKFANRH